MMKSFRISLATIAIAVCTAFSTPAGAQEMRALWVDAFHNGFLNGSQVTSLVNTCRTYNYNAVIVQMRRRGDAWYMPQAPNQEPRTTALSSNFDALQDLINKCNSGSPKIQVHVWVPTFLVWSGTSAPPQSGHIYNQHPEYLMRNSSGATQIGEGYYVDPGNPDAMQWTYNMAADIVSRYNIDGFHWDYVRYPQQNSGYNPTAIARYNAEFGLSGQPSSSNAQFSNWRRRQVTDFVRWANSDLMGIKPNIMYSAAVFASRSDAYNARFQDWASWCSEGIVDVIFPMNYTSDNSLYNSRVNDIVANQGIRRAYMGPGAYMNTPYNTRVQLNYMKNAGLSGFALYSYAVPNTGTVNQSGTFSYLKQYHQPTYQSVPALPWKSNPTRGLAKGTIKAQSNGAPIYNATVTINTPSQKTIKTEPHGKYAFFEVPPGTYSVTASASGYNNASGSVNVTAGGVVNLNLNLTTGGGGGGSTVIVDNPAANVVGSWVTATSASNKYGTNYYYKGGAGGSSYVQFRPNLPTSGQYVVSEWHSHGTNRVTSARHVISRVGGSNTVYVNQQANGGSWNTLGTFSFNAGTSGYVRIYDNGSGSQVVIADAIKFELVAPADIIVDNADGGFSSGSGWTLATSAVDKYGANYEFHSTGSSSNPATFSYTVPVAGSYSLSTWYCQGSNRSASTPYVITRSGGTSTVNVNQQTGGGSWRSLGSFNLNSGGGQIAVNTVAPSGYVVIADAVKLVKN